MLVYGVGDFDFQISSPAESSPYKQISSKFKVQTIRTSVTLTHTRTLGKTLSTPKPQENLHYRPPCFPRV
ncbi:hypothetical protein L2E82_33709 [Cichorium intybus]|uniref:Uncharacterized protein n=1 Tax=Cichorium intybus TaxID=13427 RepID=A0ACB9BKY3_CICIN|nr:hypothetical protein L2E82_33709 [Cichorium intybus]